MKWPLAVVWLSWVISGIVLLAAMASGAGEAVAVVLCIIAFVWYCETH
jgi:hypothetical protein